MERLHSIIFHLLKHTFPRKAIISIIPLHRWFEWPSWSIFMILKLSLTLNTIMTVQYKTQCLVLLCFSNRIYKLLKNKRLIPYLKVRFQFSIGMKNGVVSIITHCCQYSHSIYFLLNNYLMGALRVYVGKKAIIHKAIMG